MSKIWRSPLSALKAASPSIWKFRWAIHNRTTEKWCEIYGEKGGCEWGENPGIYRDLFDTPINSTPQISSGDPWKGEMQHFVDCIINNQTPDPDAKQGVAMMKMLDGIYASAASGREVEIG